MLRRQKTLKSGRNVPTLTQKGTKSVKKWQFMPKSVSRERSQRSVVSQQSVSRKAVQIRVEKWS
jgi:hypothetical protein